MVLTPASLVHYLLERSFVSAESLVRGDFQLLDVSRRNLDFKVIRRGEPSYFVKQIKHWEPVAIGTLQREAKFHWLVLKDPAFQVLASLAPKCHAYDPEHHILIHELLTGGQDLTELHNRLGRFPVEIGRLLGETLGGFHRRLRAAFRDDPPGDFPGNLPWIFSIHEKQYDPSEPLSAADWELVQIVRQYPVFIQTLEDLTRSWERSTLIHGDMKWENCILISNDAGSSLRIVDWEMADWGDGLWDVGGVLQAYLTFWIRSLPFHPATENRELVKQSLYPLEALHPAIGSFWNSYAAAAEIGSAAIGESLARSVRYAATRMIQSAYENMSRTDHVTPAGIRMLQAAFNILSRPSEAIAELLGLDACC